MKPERWAKVEQLYHAALERLPGERRAFLDDACAGDQDLQQEVESLLAYDEPAQDFIATPPGEMAAGLLAAAQPHSIIGSNLNHYRILALLGRGGMGEVYLAQDARLGRKVAIKLLSGEFTAKADRLQRFEQEARAASALNHPNILTIHEIGVAALKVGRAHYIVSEFVEGQTLRALMQNGRLGIGEATALVEQVASALGVAHGAGIIHRDIKPENVMVRPDGLVKVLDFGLAKLTEQSAAATKLDTQAPTIDQLNTNPGVVLGTVSYMSPEQARGQKVDHRTDIFSLGVLLYEMLAEHRPFAGASTSDVIAALLTAKPPSLRNQVPQVPAELERITEKCLAKDCEARYQSAQELMAELKPLRTSNQTKETAARRTAETTGARFVSRRWLQIATVVTLLLVGLGWFLSWRRPPAFQPGQIESLAVLPLENLSSDPAQEYFADGVTDALIGDLAKIGALRVISRTSAMRYKGTKKSLPQIARELRVDAVVEGTVLRVGNRVLIRAQLIHAATERHLWVETFERDLRDVLKLQSEVAQTIAHEIQTKVTSAEQARLATSAAVNRKAFDDYLQGRYLYWNKRTKENLEKAIGYFQSAIKEDPAYAQAYAGLADCYNNLGAVMIGGLPPREARRRAEEAARKALEFDSELAEAHAALGYANHYNWNWDAAEAGFKRALEINPNYANAHMHYSQYLVSRGRVEEAIAEANRARALDPFSLNISALRGYVLETARHYPEAIEQLRSVIAMDPNHYAAHWFLGHTLAMNGQFEEALASAEKAVALSGRAPGALGFLGMAYGLAGRKDEAHQILKELLELNRRHYVTPAALASVYIGLGDKEQAFAWLEQAFQERSNYLAYLQVQPTLDPLRSDPRFDELLLRIGLTR